MFINPKKCGGHASNLTFCPLWTTKIRFGGLFWLKLFCCSILSFLTVTFERINYISLPTNVWPLHGNTMMLVTTGDECRNIACCESKQPLAYLLLQCQYPSGNFPVVEVVPSLGKDRPERNSDWWSKMGLKHVNSLKPGWGRITEHDEFKSDLQFVCSLTDVYVNIS